MTEATNTTAMANTTNTAPTLTRPLFCPICGRRVTVQADGQFPEVHRLPEHSPPANVNLCCGLVITVTIAFDECRECGAKMSVHPSGLCMRCCRKGKS